MKARGIAILDYTNLDFKTAAKEQEKLEKAIKELVAGSPNVVYSQVDMKERRGDAQPDITKLKFRQT